jgi:hypothetical protein
MITLQSDDCKEVHFGSSDPGRTTIKLPLFVTCFSVGVSGLHVQTAQVQFTILYSEKRERAAGQVRDNPAARLPGRSIRGRS